MASDLLPSALLARLERLQVSSRRPLVGGLVGEHRSPRFGSSLDFSDYRQYHPGDDLRRIDVNAYARFDRLLLKLFEAEDDVTVRLLVDTSGSMAGDKLERAKRFAAAVGFVALTNRDIVTLHTFPATREGPRMLGRAAVGQLFSRLETLEAGGDTPFAAASLAMLSRPGPAGITVVISDLLTEEWDAGLRRLPAGNGRAPGDLAVIQILDRTDVTPDVTGDLQLVDSETGATVDVSISSAVASDYTSLAESWLAEVAGRVRRSGAGYARVFTDEDLEASIMSTFTQSGVLK